MKAYNHKIRPNRCKKEYIENVLYKEFVRVYKILLNRWWKEYYTKGKIVETNDLYKHVDSFLTERFKDVINRQVLGQIKSKITNAKKTFVRVVLNSTLDSKVKKDMCIISKYNLFFQKDDCKIGNADISLESIKLARKIYKMFFGKGPTCKNINMTLQDKVATIEHVDSLTHHSEFKYILKLSAGDRNKRGSFIYIPICKNTYFEKFEGVLSKSCSLNFKKGKLTNITFFKNVVPKEIDKDKREIAISIDIGLNVLFALDNGECYGKHFLRRLKRLDGRLIFLQNMLKDKYGKHTRLSFHAEYDNAVKQIKDYTKNEINRLLNKIISKHNPKKIVVENLDFRNSNIGRKNNRLLHKFGLGYINKKLDELKIDKKIEIKKINPAYTSQTCSSCGYVDKANRKNQNSFVCKCCGLKLNADVNGSRVIKMFEERFSNNSEYKINKGDVLTLVVDNFVNSKVWVDNLRLSNVLIDNKYFSRYHEILRKNIMTLLS